MRRRISLAVAAILVVYALVYVVPLGVRPLFSPDELRYAEIGREILASGDWIVPRLNGLRYFEKPMLGYWSIAGSAAAFGVNPFAVRLPSALAVGLSALALLLLLRRTRGAERSSLLAVAVYLTSVGVYAVGVFAVLDSLLSLFITGALVSFFLADRAGTTRERQLFLALLGTCCGLAFLTKGVLGVALPATAVVPFLLWERRPGELRRMFGMPLLFGALVVLPWSLLIALREGDYWRYFIMVEHWQRFASPDADHPKPFWYLWAVTAGAIFPWTAALPAALRGLRGRGLDPLARFALCWLLGPLLLLSASRGKLATYALPVLPAVCILVALGLERANEGAARGFRSAALVISALAAALATAIFMDREVADLAPIHALLDGTRWRLLCAALLSWALLAAAAAREPGITRSFWTFAAGPLLTLFLAPWVLADRRDNRTALDELVATFAQRVRPDAMVVADSRFLYAANLALARQDLYQLRPGELEYGLAYPGESARLMDSRAVQRAIYDDERDRDLVLISEPRTYAELRGRLPTADLEDVGRSHAFALFRARAHVLQARGPTRP